MLLSFQLVTRNSCFTISHSFLVNNATFASDNRLRFKLNLLERIQQLITAVYDKVRDEKLQYNINREAAKT